jgi:acetyl esterase/lipase
LPEISACMVNQVSVHFSYHTHLKLHPQPRRQNGPTDALTCEAKFRGTGNKKCCRVFSKVPQFMRTSPMISVSSYIAGGQPLDHTKQQLDIYVPNLKQFPSTDPFPVNIHVHGGGWQRGDRKTR